MCIKQVFFYRYKFGATTAFNIQDTIDKHQFFAGESGNSLDQRIRFRFTVVIGVKVHPRKCEHIDQLRHKGFQPSLGCIGIIRVTKDNNVAPFIGFPLRKPKRRKRKRRPRRGFNTDNRIADHKLRYHGFRRDAVYLKDKDIH